MKDVWKKSAVALTLSVALVGCGGDKDNNDGDRRITPAFEMQLLHFADVDGGRDIIGNATRFSALVEHFRAQYPDNTLLLSSGDNWIPGPEYNIAAEDSMTAALGVAGAGRAHIAYLNALGVQASAFGNHEFDLGTDDIAAMLSTDETYAGAQFPYLSTNLDFSKDEYLSPLVATNGSNAASVAGKIAGSTVISVNGELIGVVGATTPTLATISSPGEDITITPATGSDYAALAAAIQPAVDALTAQGITKVILLSHMQQIAIEKALAPLLSGVDIIVAGGSNTILADENDRLREGDVAADTYPIQLMSAANEPVLVVNTDGDYTYVGRLLVGFDDKGVVVKQNLAMDTQTNGAYAADAQGMAEQGLNAAQDAAAGVTLVSNALTTALTDVAGKVLGVTNVYLNGERASVRTEETNLGNLTAQANLAYAKQQDENVSVSIKNGGGIRASIGACLVPAGSTDGALVCHPPMAIPAINLPAGGISQLDIQTALRFNNSLTLLTLTGQQLKAIVEHAVAGVSEGSTPGSFGQFAGLRFSYDPDNTAQEVTDGVITTQGQRVVNMVVDDAQGNSLTVVQNGTVLMPATEFRVVTLGYLAGGGDAYPFPSDASAQVVDLLQEDVKSGAATFADNGSEQDALAEYLLANHADAASAFAQADAAAKFDARIQNLNVVMADTILPSP